MKFVRIPRQNGDWPIGAFVLAGLFFIPLAGFLTATGAIEAPPCSLRVTTGIPCLSCGGTRATLYLLTGDLRSAIAHQPFLLLCYFFGLYWGIISLWGAISGRRWETRFRPIEWKLCLAGIVLLIALNWMYLFYAGI